MNMNLYPLFVAVAEKGNFSRAAEELFLSQPAVSQMIGQLEQELDCKLFTRQSRGVSLTTEGQEFYHLVKKGLQQLDKANLRIKEMKSLEWGKLRLGASDTISRYILPKHLKEFTNRNPEIRITIQNGTSLELETMLLNGEIDLVIGFEPKHSGEIVFKTLMTLHEVFVTSEEYLRKIPQPLTSENINQVKIMLLDEKSQTRKEINKLLLLQNIMLKPEVELANYELLAEFAKQGLGIAILSKELVEGLHVIDSTIDLPTRNVGYYYKKKTDLSLVAKAFISTLNE